MEDNNKPTSEFENLVKEATGEIPTVNNDIKEDTNSVEVKKEEPSVDDVVVVDEEVKEDNQVPKLKPSIELPQKKDEEKSSIPESVSASSSDSQVLGTIKPDKQKSPLAMLILFGVLIIFIVFMPTAISLFNKYFGTNLNIDSLNNPTKVDTPVKDDDQKQNIKMYNLKEDTVIQLDKIEFGGFKKDNTDGLKISFYIKNTGSLLYKFDKKVYLEYYDDNNTFVGRTYLENVKEITGGITNNYSLTINDAINNAATKVEVVQRTDDDYPAITLQAKQLTCSNDTDSIVYTFDESSRLTNIKDMYTYTKDEDVMKYNNDLISYKSKISKLDSLEGVTAVLTETDTGFMTTTAIDYQYADYSKLSSNTNYYIKDTYAKIISFEMNAKGYTCR